MTVDIKNYLDNIKASLRLDPSSEKEIVYELYTHLEERVQELKEAGLPEEEAIKIATEHFGSARAVAGEINQTHSSGNWAQALIAAFPHFLFALLFAFHQWHNIGWLIAIFVSIVGVVVYGWWHSKPIWFFPWLGYSLIPVSAVGIILLSFLGKSLSSSWWVWLATLAYIPISLWLFVSVGVQAVRRDWLLGSLMALPLSAVAGWFLVVQRQSGFLEPIQQRFYDIAPWITFNLLFLASAVILFIRLRQRFLKAMVLLLAGLAILASVICSNSLDFPGLLVLALVVMLLFFAPALLERKIGHGEQKATWLEYPHK